LREQPQQGFILWITQIWPQFIQFGDTSKKRVCLGVSPDDILVPEVRQASMLPVEFVQALL